MIIKELTTAPDERWDAFVRRQDMGTFFHLSGWKRAVERAFGHKTRYLYAEEAGEIRGVLPLVRIKSLFFGTSIVSNAFCVYGGPLAADAAALAQLDDAAAAFMDESGADYLEYRCRDVQHPDWPAKNELYATFRKLVTADHDANLNAIPRKQRAMVRKGIKAGLTSERDDTAARFFPVFAESVRNLGTPVFPRRWFDILKSEFGDDCEILIILHEERPIAAVLSFYFRDEVLPYYGGSLYAARPVGGNDFMYWEVMCRAVERGARIFDFGRSKVDTGAYAFKKHWGFEPEPLTYEYRLKEATAIPEINPLNPKYRLLVAAWQRLPLWAANRVGPVIARSLG